MPRFLMRSHMPFYDVPSISSILKHNWIGTNTGNIIFQRAVARTVMTSDSTVVAGKFNKFFSDEQMDEINNKFDYVVLPMADAFRSDFMHEMRATTAFIKRLKIPCAIVGIGINGAGVNDEDIPIIKHFVKTALKHSAMLGVRGYATAHFLSRLGFMPDRDFTVIGCPSMYMYGDNLPQPRLSKLTPDSYVACCAKPNIIRPIYRFLKQSMSNFPRGVLVSQVLHELKQLYMNHPFPSDFKNQSWFPHDYPTDMTHKMIASNRMLGFADINSWINWMRTRDFCFGVRIHGCIAGVLAGVPVHILSNDMRIRELAAYHNIPLTTPQGITDNTTIFDLYNNTDYSLLHVGHSDRFSHYLKFLEINGIPHVEREVLNTNSAPFDVQCGHFPLFGPIYPFATQKYSEQFRRTCEWQKA